MFIDFFVLFFKKIFSMILIKKHGKHFAIVFIFYDITLDTKSFPIIDISCTGSDVFFFL